MKGQADGQQALRDEGARSNPASTAYGPTNLWKSVGRMQPASCWGPRTSLSSTTTHSFKISYSVLVTLVLHLMLSRQL